MLRADIISLIGRDYLVSNIENGEFSYQKALKNVGKNYEEYLNPANARKYKNVDLRFAGNKLTILVETKNKLSNRNLDKCVEQLQQYVLLEEQLTDNKIVAILAATENEDIYVWDNNTNILQLNNFNKKERSIKPFTEYESIYFNTKNDKATLMQNTYKLNDLLFKYTIPEDIRSQFVGMCLLALKNNLKYEGLTNKQIRAGMEGVLDSLLGNIHKAEKLVVLKNCIDSQQIRKLKDENFHTVLRFIESNILPFINEESTQGQDLLNLFFTTFNKYAGQKNKNQAFTPDHIVHFMCKVVGVNRNSVVLDPCCGSGAFLVRAMHEALIDCDTQEQKDNVKKKQIYGIEYDDKAFALSTTNMLIHGDGNTNIMQGSCFEIDDYKDAGINIVLMNPPYNATGQYSDPEYSKTWKNSKEDPSKGFHFVYHIANIVKTGKLAVLLPMQCAIGTTSEVQYFKRKMLEEHNLEAVFSLPSEMFQPGANVCACCMVFNLGVRHDNAAVKETFFGYFKDDGHVKKKYLGRIEKTPGTWKEIEKKWLYLYFNRKEEKGMSAVHKVTYLDEWLAEAYMETDYSTLTEASFENTLRSYYSYLVKDGFNEGN